VTAGPQSLSSGWSSGRAAHGTAPLIAGVGVLMVGNGLLLTLFGVRATKAGFGPLVVGVVLSAYFVGFLAGSRVTPAMIRRAGSRRSFCLLAAAVAVVAVFPPVAVVPWFWVSLRLAQGFGVAGLYVVIESWLNASASNANRGRVLGAYVAVMMAGFAVGALLYRATGAGGAGPFLVASAAVLLAMVGVWFLAGEPPAAVRGHHLSFRELMAVAPLGTVAAFATAIANSALLGVAAVYATRSGFSVGRTAVFASLGSFGALVFQAPLMRLADRHPRPRVLLGITMSAGVVALVLVFAPTGGLLPMLGMLLLGGLSYSQYSIVLAEVNDHLEHHHMASAGAHLVAVNGVGSALAPLLVAFAFVVIGDQGYFWALGGVHILTGLAVVTVAWSARRRRVRHTRFALRSVPS
jgi:MFS family permease